MLVGAGGGGDSNGMDAANMLKPALARGELQYIEKDPALERRFQPVIVPEPSEEEAVRILQGLAPRYESHHEVMYTREALEAAVRLSSQYIADRHLPDKAVDVIDEAGSGVRQNLHQATGGDSSDRDRAKLELEKVLDRKAQAVSSERYAEAGVLKEQERDLRARLENGRLHDKHVEELRALRAQKREVVAAEDFEEAMRLKSREDTLLEQMSGRSIQALAEQSIRITEEDIAQVV